jgi:glycosyltransferase involved in cell wall biosynthesis
VLTVPPDGSAVSEPLVTVIITFLDVKAFLAEAVESVLAQTYTSWELLLIDDGSQDGSRALAERFSAARPERIRCIEHEGHANRGISASRNLGLRHAQGSLIAFLDADDRWVPTKLADQITLAHAHPEVGLFVAATRYWYSWSGRPEDQAKDELMQVGGPRDRVCYPPELVPVLYPLGRGTAPSMNTLLVRKSMIERIGGFEDRFRGAFEDQAFLIKAYLWEQVYISSLHADDYRRERPGSITATELAGKARGEPRGLPHYRFYSWLEDFLRSQNLEGSVAWRLTQERLRTPDMRRFRHPLLWRVETSILVPFRKWCGAVLRRLRA